MPVCVVCSSPAPHKCAACKNVSYCSPAHQKADWQSHKRVCPRLALEGSRLALEGSVCAVCPSPAYNTCSKCAVVFYCSPAHQREDWGAHKLECPRLALEALTMLRPCDEKVLLGVTACLAQSGYHKEVGVMVQLNKAFWSDAQIWDAFKDYTPSRSKRTRLMHASGNGFIIRVKQLLARGAKVNARLGDGNTALGFASMCGHLEVVRELCLRKADVNTTLDNGYTPLMIASERGFLPVVRELCAEGASVNAAKFDNYMTALMFSSNFGHLKVVQELLKRGADVNKSDISGWTSLMWASKFGFLEIVRELCSRGANVNAARTDTGTTVLMIASFYGQLDTASLLLEKGADKSMRAFDSSTAFSLAKVGRNFAGLQTLLLPCFKCACCRH